MIIFLVFVFKDKHLSITNVKVGIYFMLMTAKQAQLQQLENAVVLDEETKSILAEALSH